MGISKYSYTVLPGTCASLEDCTVPLHSAGNLQKPAEGGRIADGPFRDHLLLQVGTSVASGFETSLRIVGEINCGEQVRFAACARSNRAPN
jgi:hypothetical protein